MRKVKTRLIPLLSLLVLLGAVGCASRNDAPPTAGQIRRALQAAADKRWDDVMVMVDETPSLLVYDRGTVGGYSLMCYALEQDNLDMACLFLDIQTGRGDAARMKSAILRTATGLGDYDLVRKMVEDGADVKNAKRLLSSAIASDDLRMFDYLVEHGANIYEEDCGNDLLFFAVFGGRRDFAKRLIDLGLSFDRPLLDAAARGDCAEILRIIESDPKMLYCANPQQRLSILHVATGLGYLDIVKICLKLGLDVDTRNARQETPLFFAGNQPQIARYLLEHGAQVNALDKYGYTPIFSTDDNPEVTRLLIKHGADATARPYRCFVTLLQGTDNSEVLRLLLEAGADPNAAAQWAFHIMPFYCAYHDIRDIKLLLDHGADPNYPGSCGFVSSLASAIENNRADVVELLLARGAEIDLHEVVESHLCYAVKVRRFEMMRLLMKHGATLGNAFLDAVLRGDVEAVRKMAATDKALLRARDEFEGRDALCWAIKTEQPEMVRALLDCGADPNLADEYGAAAVHAAAENELLEIMEILLASGANPKAATTMGGTPIHTAAANGDLKMIELLLSAGADVNAEDHNTNKPLDYLAQSPCEDGRRMIFLIEHGADVDKYCDDPSRNVWALHKMAAAGHTEIVAYMLEKGADIDAVNKYGASALTEAVCANKLDMIEFLVANGASVSGANRHGATLLHLAESREVAELLLDRGLDIDAEDNEGCTPLEYTKHRGDVARLLVERGAKVRSDCIRTLLTWCDSQVFLKILIKQGVSVELPADYQYELFRFYSFDRIKTLLDCGLKIDATDPRLLEAAVINGSLELVRYLVSKGADVNGKGADFPPLFVAARDGYWDIADFLITRGADVNEVVDEDGQTALGIAEENGHKNLVKLLRAHGAKEIIDEEE